jgi:aminoacyl-tRNA hydrolase
MHRARLDGTTFVGVTGSVGKTTTKAFIGAVLSTTLEGRLRNDTRNNVHSAARSLVEYARSGDAFHVVELSAAEPGWLARQLRLVRPSVGVVTAIGSDHHVAFGSVDAIAAEKSRLIQALPSHGTAVLNADDSRVLAMRALFSGRAITYGLGEHAAVRATNVSSSWPETLSFDLSYQDVLVHVQTQLCGAHWVSAALAAAATGVAFDIPLTTIAAALGTVEPVKARMSPVVLDDGVTFMRDDCKAPVGTIPPALDFLRDARAKRKIAVIGTISDTVGDAGRVYVNAARHALEVADVVCFVGPRAFAAMRAQPGNAADRLRAFGSVRAAKGFLDSILAPGDLVLLKGSNTTDHLYRLILSRVSAVECWRMDCKRHGYCDRCELVTIASGQNAATPDTALSAQGVGKSTGFAGDRVPNFLIGLGNPGEHRAHSPHNVGYAVLDRLAAASGAAWRSDGEASIATLEWNGEPAWLVKPAVAINRSGPAVHALANRLGFLPEHCILIHDDLDLPLGTVRTRMRGSDGGHRGVRSILEAFQTDTFRRVKVGVKRPGDTQAAKDAVLAPFTADEQASMAAAFDQAEQRLASILQEQTRQRSRTAGRSDAPAGEGTEAVTGQP